MTFDLVFSWWLNLLNPNTSWHYELGTMSGQDTIIRSQGWEVCRTDNDKCHNDYNAVFRKRDWVSVMHEQQNHHSWVKTELAKRKLHPLWFLCVQTTTFLIHKYASIMNGVEARPLGKGKGQGSLHTRCEVVIYRAMCAWWMRACWGQGCSF